MLVYILAWLFATLVIYLDKKLRHPDSDKLKFHLGSNRVLRRHDLRGASDTYFFAAIIAVGVHLALLEVSHHGSYVVTSISLAIGSLFYCVHLNTQSKEDVNVARLKFLAKCQSQSCMAEENMLLATQAGAGGNLVIGANIHTSLIQWIPEIETRHPNLAKTCADSLHELANDWTSHSLRGEVLGSLGNLLVTYFQADIQACKNQSAHNSARFHSEIEKVYSEESLKQNLRAKVFFSFVPPLVCWIAGLVVVALTILYP